MSITAAPIASKLTLSYKEGGGYALNKVSLDAGARELLQTARGINVFQEDTLKDVCNYVECVLEEE